MHAQNRRHSHRTRTGRYPVECLDMVVAHELVHLLEPSHNQRFHALLDTYCPDNRALSRGSKKPPADEL